MKRILFYFRKIKRKRKKSSQKTYLEHKESARKIASARLEHFNKHYGFKIGRISVRNQASRWGSCSSKGNLNFNYKIALVAPHLADYIVVHELCHLKQFNHSQKFWDLVGETIPDYLKCRAELMKIRIR